MKISLLLSILSLTAATVSCVATGANFSKKAANGVKIATKGAKTVEGKLCPTCRIGPANGDKRRPRRYLKKDERRVVACKYKLKDGKKRGLPYV